MRNTVIIGGGIAGLISGIQLASAGIPCVLIEKQSYPLHRVCGEYISNEAVPFLMRNRIYPTEYSPPQINRFQLLSVTGKQAILTLDFGGFGIPMLLLIWLYIQALLQKPLFAIRTERFFKTS